MLQRLLFIFSLLIPFQIFSQQSFVPHQLLLMIKYGVDESQIENQLDLYNDNAKTISSAACIAKSWNIWQLNIENGFDEMSVMKQLKEMPQVIFVQLNHYTEERFIPNDIDFTNQWALDNQGQNGGVIDADMDAPEAWDFGIHATTASGDSIVVAIDDGGCDTALQDLHFHKNYFDIPYDHIDNDHNGYVDDYNGWNSVSNNSSIPADMHGTHCAGIAGAIGNDTIGISGVDPDVMILPVKGSSNTEAIVVAGYAYIFDQRKLYNQTLGDSGIFVVSVNSSFGINNGQPSNYPLWSAMYDSMGKVGILNCAATANAPVDVDVAGDIPTACPSNFLISVTNTTNQDALSTIAAYGDTTIDLGAPGTNILSTFPNNQYGSLTGTSMATPQVSGAVAFLYSLPCLAFSNLVHSYPDSAAMLVKSFIMNGVDTLPTLWGKTVSNGRLNLYNSSLFLMQHFGCPVGVNEISNQQLDFNLFPNPADDEITLRLKTIQFNQYHFTITNMLGQKIFSSAITSPTTHISLNNFYSGIYLVMISDEANNIIATEKFVKE